jgi:hypothetical protein
MDVFADAVVSLEYYLDNRRWDPSFDDSMLSVAEGCLTRLESCNSWFVLLTSVAAKSKAVKGVCYS